MRRLILTALAFMAINLCVAPVHAASHDFGGAVTREQALEIALGYVPGKLKDVTINKYNGYPVYRFEIVPEWGGMVYVSVETETGYVSQIKVVKKGKEGEYPQPEMTAEQADGIALDAINESVRRGGLIEKKGVELGLNKQGIPVYTVLIQRRHDLYEVVLDAFTGEIFSMQVVD